MNGAGKIRRLNWLPWLLLGSLLVAVGLTAYVILASRRGGDTAESLTVYCAAALRIPVEKAAEDYQNRYGVAIRMIPGASNTLLSQIEVGRSGDLYIPGDDSYIELGRKKGLVAERIPLATMQPVLAVAKGNPKNIRALDDLLRKDVRVALADPDQAAIGKCVRQALTDGKRWDELQLAVRERGATINTEPEAASAVKLGSVDAAFVWDVTGGRMHESTIVRLPELAETAANVTLGVLTSAKQPAAALHFARFLSAGDRGLKRFADMGWKVAEGDEWAHRPKLVFFAGAVNRRAVEPVIEKFQQREGVSIDTSFNGCGILTGQMEAARRGTGAFPDVYMACDVYYLDVVADWFQDARNISNTDIVIAVPKGNPKGIQTLRDLGRPGLRITVGEPTKATIGVLTQRLLERENVLDDIQPNVVARKASSAQLVPDVVLGHADAALAYRTDTLAEKQKIDVILIDSPLAKAVQPFSIAKSSKHKELGRRFMQSIVHSKEHFESAGFNFQAKCICGEHDGPQPDPAPPDTSPKRQRGSAVDDQPAPAPAPTSGDRP